MKKQSIYICASCILLALIISNIAHATGGGLRKSSLKTCPDGITYGMHGDGNGGQHWHVAITNGENYYADGPAIAYDPCPDSKKNEGTAGSTSGSASSSASGLAADTDNQYVQSSLNNDATISELIVDGKNIPIEDAMMTTVSKEDVEVIIRMTDTKATSSFDNRSLELGNNSFTITTIAENGDKREYLLNIVREVAEGAASIQKFEFGKTKVEFVNGNGSVSVLSSQNESSYSYELSDKNAELKIYRDNKLVNSFKDFDEVTDYKLVVIDSDKNEKLYYLHVSKLSSGDTAAAFVIAGVIFIGFPATAVAIAKKIKK